MEYVSTDNLVNKHQPIPSGTTSNGDKVRAKISWCLETAKAAGLDLNRMDPIYVRQSLKGASTAGRATHKRGIHNISLHSGLLASMGDAYINQTVVHEVAHCIQRHVWPRSQAHGYEWQKVMHILGVPAKRCSNYGDMPPKNRMARPYIYKCACREHKLTHILHDRIRQGSWRKCLRCRVRIEFVKVA